MPKSASNALPLTTAKITTLGKKFSRLNTQNPNLTGVYLLNSPVQSFTARMQMIAQAEKTLDVQYYIWQKDIAGSLILNALVEAAQRGVRVRLLLDDNGISGLDQTLIDLNQLPNFEVRIFNPFIIRNSKPLAYALDFKRLNHRMHNKSITADNQLTIIGGRNIADSYFNPAHNILFSDLDVLAIGEVVNKISIYFDQYWHHQISIPVNHIIKQRQPQNIKQFNTKTKKLTQTKLGKNYLDAIKDPSNQLIDAIANDSITLSWSKTTLVSDDPDKALKQQREKTLLVSKLQQLLRMAKQDLLIVSPYFIPGKRGMEELKKLTAKNINITILTNSLAATDVKLVHAGYSKYRKQMLKNNIKLFELAAVSPNPVTKQNTKNLGDKHFLVYGSAYTSLHAKTFVIDDKQVFVGSFNFDPRSANLNTELGFIIDNPQLAKQIKQEILHNINSYAYAVKLNSNNKLYWEILDKQQNLTRYFSEPNTSKLKRFYTNLMRLLPIEPLL